MIEDIKNIKSTKKELREFGLTIGIILLILGGIALWRGKEIAPYFLGVGAALAVSGIVLPAVLKPFQKVWMGFSVVMGFFMSRLILLILFFLVLTPMSILTRILGKDILDQRIDKDAGSYWHHHLAEVKDKKTYENQY